MFDPLGRSSSGRTRNSARLCGSAIDECCAQTAPTGRSGAQPHRRRTRPWIAGAAPGTLSIEPSTSAAARTVPRRSRQADIPAMFPQLERSWNPLGGWHLSAGRAAQTTAMRSSSRSAPTAASCATCHQPPSGMSISLRNVRARVPATGGNDPLFAPVDGANCPNAVPAATRRPGGGEGRGSGTTAPLAAADRGTIRMPLPWPPRRPNGRPKPVEFDLAITPQDDRPAATPIPATGSPPASSRSTGARRSRRR